VTDAVAIQLISSVATVVTVVVTGWFNRKTTRDKASEIHNKIDTMSRVTAESRTSELVTSDRAVDMPLQKDQQQ
jgi:hypothetical protein